MAVELSGIGGCLVGCLQEGIGSWIRTFSLVLECPGIRRVGIGRGDVWKENRSFQRNVIKRKFSRIFMSRLPL